MSSYNEFYKFSFNGDNTGVLSMSEVSGNKTKLQKISGSTFDVEVGVNDLSVTDVLSVTRTKLSKGFTETTVYTDVDGDGNFEQAFEMEVAGAGVKTSKLEKLKFTVDANTGDVLGVQELKRGKWVNDRIEADESFEQIDLDGVNYIVKSEQDGNGVEFELFRDDNADGIWTQVAEGEASGDFLTLDGSVDLVGVKDYLLVSETIVG
jgi:hypothetical protein